MKAKSQNSKRRGTFSLNLCIITYIQGDFFIVIFGNSYFFYFIGTFAKKRKTYYNINFKMI